jgi:hypothetical protein
MFQSDLKNPKFIQHALKSKALKEYKEFLKREKLV